MSTKRSALTDATNVPKKVKSADSIEIRQKTELDELNSSQKKALKKFKKAQEQELGALEKRHAEELTVAIKVTKESPGECGESECKVLVKEDYFVCNKCTSPFCNSHRTDTTECIERDCKKTYCVKCVREINKCAGCYICPQLTCCKLKKMPCGEYESGDCDYYHHKHCRCQKGESDFGSSSASDSEDEDDY